MDIEVHKHNRIRTEPPYVFYVGRSQLQRYYGTDRCLSALGNPFTLAPGGDREEVIASYRKWLWHKVLEHDDPVVGGLEILGAAYQQHGKLRLVCHCVSETAPFQEPMVCHAQVIARCLRWRSNARAHSDT